MKTLFTFFFTLIFAFGYAQIVTPGTGQTYTFEDFATDFTGTVTSSSEGHYTLLQDITLSAGDTLLLDESTKELFFQNTLTINIYGPVVCEPRTDTLVFTSNTSHCNGDYYDIRIDNAGTCQFADILFEYGKNILIMGTSTTFERCEFRYFTEQCIKYMNANPVIENCYFHENRQAAINSAVNVMGAPIIRNNIFYHNVLNNANQPQLNLGPCAAGQTIIIENNEIEGSVSMSGGIAIANLMNVGQTTAIIRGNTITNNRYGYTQNGSNVNSIIENNIITDNNLETNPMNGGSGISIYGSDTTCAAKLRRNIISGNLWGITAINKHHIDMGTASDPGYNCITDNENDGITYALYNNATSDMDAIGNYWGSGDTLEVENVIFHYADNSMYGRVNYMPILETDPDILSVPELEEPLAVHVTPNPVCTGNMTVHNNCGEAVWVEVFSVSGQPLYAAWCSYAQLTIPTADWSNGLYLLKATQGNRSHTLKVVVNN
ncbi:MAG: T9SS type A sorting domain-containing protein [Bacteroidales bacterium]|nr:T9SS type A sorting domain-containing protein [Bacteroidales bacterium]